MTNPPAEYAWTATAYSESPSYLLGMHERPKKEWDYHCILELCVGDKPRGERPGGDSVRWLIRVLSHVFTTLLNPGEKIAKLEEEGITNISEEFRKELMNMTTYGQGCFDNGVNRGIIIGEEKKCKQVIINLLRMGYDKALIKEIASCSN